jgi:hypothetical protein
MEVKITTNQMLKVLQILSWIVFIGLCVEAGGIIVNTFITLVINPLGVKNFWEGADYLAGLYTYDRGHFFVITLTMAIVAVLKSIMFYHIVKLFVDKKLNISQPFNLELRRFIVKLSCLAAGIGLFSHVGVKYAMWLTKQGAETPALHSLHLGGADVWLFMAIILFVIVQIVKRGIEIQNENDLTI